jgi:hypothetical protein
MASGAEAREIEYSARVMLALRSVENEPDCIEMRVVKNKHGRSYPTAEPIYLALDRPRQMMLERPAPDAGPVLMDQALACVLAHPAGISSEDVIAQLHKDPAKVRASLQSLESAKKIRRLKGERSPWISVEVFDVDQ